MTGQCCGTCRLFRPIEEGHSHGYCRWRVPPHVDMPDWAHVAIEDCITEKEHFTEQHMGATCDCYEEKSQ